MLDTDTANADDVDGMGLAGGTRRELGGYSRGGARGQDSRGREGGAPGQKPLPLSFHCAMNTANNTLEVLCKQCSLEIVNAQVG